MDEGDRDSDRARDRDRRSGPRRRQGQNVTTLLLRDADGTVQVEPKTRMVRSRPVTPYISGGRTEIHERNIAGLRVLGHTGVPERVVHVEHQAHGCVGCETIRGVPYRDYIKKFVSIRTTCH